MIEDFPELSPARPIWLMTLADLALLLVGFFVLVQATQALDRKALAKGIRDGFGVSVPADPMPVAASAVTGFAPGSAVLPASAAVQWARDALADPRVKIRIAGTTDGTPGDVDPATGSAAILAADRARALAAAIAASGVAAPNRITIVNAPGTPGRGVSLTQGFVGDRP